MKVRDLIKKLLDCDLDNNVYIGENGKPITYGIEKVDNGYGGDMITLNIENRDSLTD